MMVLNLTHELEIGQGRFLGVNGYQTRTSWTDAMLWYLERWSCDDRFLLWLDDYGLCAQPNFDKLQTAWEIMQSDVTVASFHLTHMAVGAEAYCPKRDVVRYPPWTYSVNTQGAFWRKAPLIELLHKLGSDNVEAFELRGSDIYNNEFLDKYVHLTFKSPVDTPLMLDSDPNKLQWAMPYHNLVNRGKWDERHRDFLLSHDLPEANPL